MCVWLACSVLPSAALTLYFTCQISEKGQSPLLAGCLEPKHKVIRVAFRGHASSAISNFVISLKRLNYEWDEVNVYHISHPIL